MATAKLKKQVQNINSKVDPKKPGTLRKAPAVGLKHPKKHNTAHATKKTQY